MLTVNEFPTNPQHLAIAMAYKNRRLIADDALPVVPVNSREFKYWEYDLADGFTIPDTLVGKFDKADEMRFKATEKPNMVENHALSETVSNEDAEDSPAGIDPLSKATERVTDLVLLGREKRVADLLFGAANYASSNKTTLSGTAQFSDVVNSDPIKQLTDFLDTMVIRANKMVIGRIPWTWLARHPKVVKAANGNSGDSGIATRQRVAELLELDDILVGESFLNTAAKGQTPSMARVWGNFLLLGYYNKLADNNGGLTLGYTAKWKGWQVKTIAEEDRGLHGTQKQLVGESVKPVLASPTCGFLISSVVA